MWVTLLFPWSSGMVLFCFSLLKSGRKLEIILLPKFGCIMVKWVLVSLWVYCMFEDTCHTIYHIIIYMIIYNIPCHNHIHDVRLFIIYTLLYEVPHGKQHTSYVIISMIKCTLRAILCKYGASYIGTISRSDSDFDETC